MGLKILHSADWHLGSSLAGFSTGERAFLKAELEKIPRKVADICRREGCDLVLLAGDLFDGPVSRNVIQLLKDVLAAMAVPVFISPGNHDYVTPGSPWLEEIWPENVHIFRGGLESVVVEQLNCRVYGAGYTAMDCPGLLEDFRAQGEERWCVGVLHGDGVNYQSPYCPVTGRQVRESGLDYLALGHNHSHGVFRSGGTVWGWPGCPMGRGWDETGSKGVYLVHLEERAEVRFLTMDGPKFRELTVPGLTQLEEALENGGNRDFYRVTLNGNGNESTAPLLERFPHMQIRDLRVPREKLWETAGEDTLEGTYFRLLREKAESESERARLAAEISRKLLDGWEVELP